MKSSTLVTRSPNAPMAALFTLAHPPAALPPEVASEPAMRDLHAQHAREMAVLKMEIDR